MSAKSSADRVKSFLSHREASKEREGKEVPTHSHRCSLVKAPKMPLAYFFVFSAAQKLNLQRKANLVTPDWNPTSKHAHIYGSNFDNSPSPASDLIPARVHRWRLKEYQMVARKIRALGKEKPSTRKFLIEAIPDAKSAQNQKTTQDELWQEMMKNKEERHFRIGNITKTFS